MSENCDYRKDGCHKYGKFIDGKWRCMNHLPTEQPRAGMTDAQWKALSDDIGDRKGLKWEWDKIDDEVKQEIRRAWDSILFGK